MATGKLSIYDGMGDPVDFVQEFKICALMKGWDEAKCFANFPVFLKAKAQRVYESALAGEEPPTTSQKAYEVVIKGCKPPDESLLVKFLSRKIKPGETVSFFALELQQLLHIAMPELQAKYQSAFLRAHLCLSLPKELQDLVNFTADNLTWDQLLVKLDYMDKRTGGPSGSLSSQYKQNALNTLIKNEPIDTFATDTRYESLPTYVRNRDGQQQQNYRSNQGSQPQFAGKCHYCKITGHRQADCMRFKSKNMSDKRDSVPQYQNRGGQFNRNRSALNNTEAVDQFSNEEFPFSISNNVMEVQLNETFSEPTVGKSVSTLLKCDVELTLYGRRHVVKALIDGGSSHSFISPRVLSDEQVLEVTNKAKRQNFSITGATGAVDCQCALTSAELRLASWMGKHTFIIANPVRKHDMILGRDFLKTNCVSVNHSNDSISIEGLDIHVNTVSAIGNSWLTKEMVIECDLNSIVCDFSSLDVCELNNVEIEQPKMSTVMTVLEETVVRGNTQRLVKLFDGCAANRRQIEPGFSLFEPVRPFPEDCLVSRSAHTAGEAVYCNVMNAGDSDIVLEAGRQLGQLTDIDRANIQFDKDVESFVPLNINYVLKEADKFKIKPDDPMLKMVGNDRLSELQRKMLMVVLTLNSDVFQWDQKGLGRTKLVEHHVNTGDSRPVQQKQYPIPTVAYDEVRKQTAQMLKDKIIRPSSSPWRSPVLLVKKKDSSGSVVGYRFCIDLTKINAVTVKDSYPLPLISKTVDRLSGAKYFSSGDLDRAFWQIGLAEEDKEKYAFVMDSKLYEPNVMPFGSMNAPSTFQRLVDRVLSGLTWKQCLVYLDDVLIFSRTFEQHLCDIHETLSRFRFAGLMLKPAKCNFAKTEVDYLGFRICEQGIRASDKKLEAMAKQKPPAITKNLFNFLCSITYYRRCVPKYGELTYQLYRMCDEKKRLCTWTPEAMKCFSILQQAFVSAPILAFPDFTKPFIIHTDASDIGISAVLLQMFELLRPLAFSGRRLTGTEQRYSASERELLGIVEGYDTNHHIVYGRHIEFYTDHKPLVTMQELKRPSGRLGRLFHRLAGVDYNLNYIPGSQNFLADFLSRSFDPDTKQAELNYLALQSTVDWSAEQMKDVEVRKIATCVAENLDEFEWLKVDFGKRWVREKKHLYIEQDGKKQTLKHGSNRVMVPTYMKSEVLQHHHDSPFSGHRGYESTVLSINKRYYWNFMPTEVEAYCKSCIKCQRFNYACLHNRAPMKSIVVTRPWQMLGLDFMGPFKATERGNRYIIVGIDHFTKYIEAAATASFDAETTAWFVVNQIICRFGMVEEILSDQGVNFESQLFAHLCMLLGTNKLHTSTYHPECNGGTERSNKTIKPNLAKFVNAEHDDWDLQLQMAISAYNCTMHSTIKMTPFEAVFGRQPVLVSDVILNNQLRADTKLKDVSYFVRALRLNADYISSLINEHTDKAQEKQRKSYDRLIKDRVVFEVGEFVKLKNFRVRPGKSKAFEAKFLGPFKIIKQTGDLNYKLLAADGSTQVVHYNRMSHFNLREGIVADPVFIPVQPVRCGEAQVPVCASNL